jgi:transposase
MSYIKGNNRGQITLMPECLEDYVGTDNPVRVVDAFVNKLDIGSLGFKSESAIEGRPGYDPRDMLKLYIYGYINKIRSSRKLMTESGRNIEVMWLLGKITPDFRCIADFRKNNPKEIKQVFREFIKLCNKAGLLSHEMVAIDGSKFKASNSPDNSYTKANAEKNIKEIDDRIAKYLAELDETDAAETKRGKKSPEVLERLVKGLKDRKVKLEDILKILETTGENQICTTDTEAKIMKTRNGFKPSFNVQTVVECENHIVVDFEVTNIVTDKGQLVADTQMAKNALEVETIETLTDKGYRGDKDVLGSLLNGDTPHIYTHDKQDCYSFEFEKTDDEITSEMLESNDAEVIKKCICAGVLPKILQKSEITIKAAEGAKTSVCVNEGTGEIVPISVAKTAVARDCEPPISMYFVRDSESDTVTCPMGQTLFRTGITHSNTEFSHNAKYVRPCVCRKCKNKCTPGRYREVCFKDGVNHKYAKYYDVTSDKRHFALQPGFHILDTITKPKVILKFYPDYDKLRLRKQTVEHPFGTVKFWNDSSHLLVRGKLKAAADLAFSFLGYNIKRVLNILGTQKMLEMINA